MGRKNTAGYYPGPVMPPSDDTALLSRNLKLTFEFVAEPRQAVADGGQEDVDEVVGGQRDHQLQEDGSRVLLPEQHDDGGRVDDEADAAHRQGRHALDVVADELLDFRHGSILLLLVVVVVVRDGTQLSEITIALNDQCGHVFGGEKHPNFFPEEQITNLANPKKCHHLIKIWTKRYPTLHYLKEKTVKSFQKLPRWRQIARSGH